MADDTEGQAGDGAAGPTTAELDQRISALDGKLDAIIDRLPGGQADGGGGQGDPADHPSSVGAEIRRQLAEKDAADKAAADKQGTADRLGSLEDRVKEMGEKPPESIVRRVEAFMGWR